MVSVRLRARVGGANRPGEAKALAPELNVRVQTEAVPTYVLTPCLQCATPPDLGDVFAWLGARYEQRGFRMVSLAVSPTFDWLRGDPRFECLLGALVFHWRRRPVLADEIPT